MTDLNALRIFRFADLELDEGRQRVTRGGTEVPLPKLSFDLLLTLAEAAPNFLSNKELMARVWPGLVIAEKTVSQRIKLLRDALGDDHDEPRYITGLRGRGYCVAAPVICITQQQAVSSAPVRRRFSRLTAALLMLAAVLTAWWLQIDSGDQSAISTAKPSTTINNFERDATVAVLPFRDLSSGTSDTFIALGIPETVLDQLSSTPGFTVIARSSSFKAAGDNLDVREIGRRLGARYLVDGSVQRIGDSLRVSAQLVDAVAGTQIWAESFDRNISEIFAIQDQIAAQVAEALGARSTALDPGKNHQHSSANLDAYLAFLRGRALLARWTIVDADAAARAFEVAVSLDPDFAAAYAYLYDARMMAEDRRGGAATPTPAQSGASSSAQALNTARMENQALIETALALDATSGAAYFARAIWADNESATRDADFRRGLELDPSNGRGITAYAEYMDRSGHRSEAKSLLERAIRIDPLSPRAYFWQVMRVFPSNPAALEAGMLGVLEIDPDYLPALQRYAKYRWMLHGELAQAIQLIEHALSIDPTNPWLLHTAIAIYLDIGDPDAARELLATAERPEVAGNLLLLLYDRDVRAAGEAALDDTAFANGVYESWGVFEALLDWSMLTGEYSRSLTYINKRAALRGDDVELNMANFRAVPAFAQISMALDEQNAARALLLDCIHWIDEYHLPKLSGVYALRIKARSLLLLGETDHALETLRESFEADDYLQWWYTLDQDPLWASLQADPRFQAIRSDVRQHIERQAALLEGLRQQNIVPRRTPVQLPQVRTPDSGS
jgi:TolB-like protein/DNA-binding winged helix-turn-helix (wHTH) protein